MATSEKLVKRFKALPSDFTWNELRTMLQQLGYTERQGNGSRSKFVGDGLPTIFLHRPHPGTIIKGYALKQTYDTLTEEGLI